MVNCEDDSPPPPELWDLSQLTLPPQKLLHSCMSTSKLLFLSYITGPTYSVYFARFSFSTESLNMANPKGSAQVRSQSRFLLSSWVLLHILQILSTNILVSLKSLLLNSIVSFLFCFYLTCKQQIKQVLTSPPWNIFLVFKELLSLQILFSSVPTPKH